MALATVLAKAITVVLAFKGSKLHHSYLHPDPTSYLWNMDGNIPTIH
ncbi:hypothetical protein TUN205_11910 [Pyrenophora tritici-repentis]|nr:hypothetical protein TUN205_11910 [Pyrenophora tritici-repentis]